MYIGIDIGSVTTKASVIDDCGKLLVFRILPTSHDRERSGNEALEIVLQQLGATKFDIDRIITTGYGRKSISFSNGAISEIICHAEGTINLFPEVKTIIDIGGQDSKIIELDEQGHVAKFQMNDKCAAGTGRFLEVMADRIMNVNIEELGLLSLNSKNPCILSSVCTVFAESEIISYLSAKQRKEDIASGLHKAIAKRVIAMGASALIDYVTPVCFTGGVAKNIGVVKAIEEELGKRLIVPEEPQITASLGAALIAKRNA
jgi:predicted CoA-substrate-specific enzyme activase